MEKKVSKIYFVLCDEYELDESLKEIEVVFVDIEFYKFDFYDFDELVNIFISLV